MEGENPELWFDPQEPGGETLEDFEHLVQIMEELDRGKEDPFFEEVIQVQSV